MRHIREGTPAARAHQRWSDYAVSLLERKVRDGTIQGAHTREVWASTLSLHLFPAFGALYLDEMRRSDVLAWKDAVAAKIAAGDYSPHTANSWLGILRSVVNSFVFEFELDRNPVKDVPLFDTRSHPTSTFEEPNSLRVDEIRAFLAAMRKHFPQHYAMTAIGFATGLRPSTLRPLRRCGVHADVLWEESVLLVRRSHTRRDEVMGCSKTGTHQRIAIPAELIEILRVHLDELPEGPPSESELLFPSMTGGFRAPSVLDKPFKAVAKVIGLRKRITPKGMRRTFQDLARAAEVRDVVTRSISGHATEQMHHHYSTPWETEQRDGLARVVSLTGMRELQTEASATRGV